MFTEIETFPNKLEKNICLKKKFDCQQLHNDAFIFPEMSVFF